MGMAAVIYKKGAPDNFVWEKIKVGSPERGQVRLRSTAVGVNFADTYHRAGIPHPMIVGDPPVVLGFEGVGEIEELGPSVTGFSVGERVCTCLPPLGAYSQERLYPADKLIKVPKDLPLDDVQLAGLILKGMTSQYLLHRTHAARAAKKVTKTVPIVFVTGADPEAAGLVSSISRPGGNVTGVSFFDLPLVGKRLALLHELVPTAEIIAVLQDPNFSEFQFEKREIETAARTMGQKIVSVHASREQGRCSLCNYGAGRGRCTACWVRSIYCQSAEPTDWTSGPSRNPGDLF